MDVGGGKQNFPLNDERFVDLIHFVPRQPNMRCLLGILHTTQEKILSNFISISFSLSALDTKTKEQASLMLLLGNASGLFDLSYPHKLVQFQCVSLFSHLHLDCFDDSIQGN